MALHRKYQSWPQSVVEKRGERGERGRKERGREEEKR